MATFFMFGKYTSETIREISVQRTEKSMDIIKDLGGEVKGVYALLGEYDLLFCINIPDVEAAMKASVALTRLTGISFSTCPAVKVEIFDRLATE
jgi:uncharacterized protein with GYD domain